METLLRPRMHLRLRVDSESTPATIETARQALLGFFAPERPSARTLADVELVLEEVLMNIAAHAYPACHPVDTNPFVALSVETSGTDVAMTFEDAGVAFDPTRANLRDLPTSLDEAQPGGLGLRLLRRRAASMNYRRARDRNVLTVSIARHEAVALR